MEYSIKEGKIKLTDYDNINGSFYSNIAAKYEYGDKSDDNFYSLIFANGGYITNKDPANLKRVEARAEKYKLKNSLPSIVKFYGYIVNKFKDELETILEKYFEYREIIAKKRYEKYEEDYNKNQKSTQKYKPSDDIFWLEGNNKFWNWRDRLYFIGDKNNFPGIDDNLHYLFSDEYNQTDLEIIYDLLRRLTNFEVLGESKSNKKEGDPVKKKKTWNKIKEIKRIWGLYDKKGWEKSRIIEKIKDKKNDEYNISSLAPNTIETYATKKYYKDFN